MPIPLAKNGSNKLRMLLYPVAAAVLAILAWLGWGYEPAADPEQRLSGAEMLVGCGALEEARREVESVLADEPEQLHALLILGMIEEREGREEKAIAAYEKARALCDDKGLRKDIDLSLIDLERRLDRLDRAERRLESFVAAHGRTAASERMAGLIVWDRGDHKSAIERLRAARELAPKDDEIGLLLAGAYIEDKRPAEARELLQGLDALGRRVGGSWKDLARLYVESGDEESALAALEHYRQLDEAAGRRLARDEFWCSMKEHPRIGQMIGG